MNHPIRFLILLATLSAAVLPSGAQPSATQIPKEAARTEMVDIGGRKLQLQIRGHGAPTVVIEAGMGEPAVESGSWNAVVEEISKTHRVCLYDRAGLGKSDPAPKLPRTSLDVANDLAALLTKARVPDPYLLVGHSYGGMHLRMFASRFPDKVLGMVLVDASHPDQDEKWLAALGPALANEPESVSKARQFLSSRQSPSSNPESIDVKASSAQVRAAHGLDDKPLVILTHSPKWRIDPSLPDDVALKIETISQQLQIDQKKISSKSSLRQADHAGHQVQAEDPGLVVEGIRQALEAAAKPTQ
jgi:pimeloyl-ACP methyl ester carboxylesterase